MKAALYDRYGPAETIRIGDIPTPEPAPDEILVRVVAAAVTTADWRLRASAFPGGLWLAGRLTTGLFRPRNAVLGSAFAGTVAGLGADVRDFRSGDRVFGSVPNGAHAEYVAIKASAAVAPMPDDLGFEDAAALPFGGDTSLVFLRDIAKLRSGQRILVLGASGAAGVYGVQIARAMGAEVTGVANGQNEALVRGLGAQHFVDYRTEDPLASGPVYDVVYDTVGAMTFAQARRILTPNGTFVPLNFSVADLFRAAGSKLRGGRTMKITVSGDTRATLDHLAGMVRAGTLRAVVDRVLPFTDIREAHRLIESRHRSGTLILRMPGASESNE